MNKKIVFDAERMRYPHTGLYHFCKNLGEALLEKEHNDYSIAFYINNINKGIFGEQVEYFQQRSIHKLWPLSLRDISLWHSTYQLSSYVPKNDKIKTLSTIHDLNFMKEGKSVDKEKKYLKKLQNNLDRADSIVAISNYVKHDLENYCDLKGKLIHVIYNGNNINQKFSDQIIPSRPSAPQFIYTIGTVNHKKNFHVLPYLLVGNEMNLIISGIVNEKEYDNYIMKIASQLGVAERVQLTGPISEEEKYNYLKDCSLFVFPSIAEGFGLPVIEAMSFGKKVLLSKYTCLPEIGGPEAFFLESTDPDYLIEFGKSDLMKIIEGNDRSNEIKAWADQFSWEKAANQYWELYNQLLK